MGLSMDDEADVRAIERRVLEGVGYWVLEAAKGADGIDRMAGAARVDLLIADLRMPVVCGDEMVRRIRLARPDMPVLHVTGHIDRLMDARSLREGEAFIEKPFTVAGLRAGRLAVALRHAGDKRGRNTLIGYDHGQPARDWKAKDLKGCATTCRITSGVSC
jgi:CheY-like chemotaxis protein